MNLKELFKYFRCNQSAISRVLGITRLTLRNSIRDDRNYIIIDGVVYKSIGKVRTDHLDEMDRLYLEERFNSECG